MKNRFTPVLVAAALVVAGIAHAATAGKPQTVHLDRDAIVGGLVVPSGTYRVDIAPGRDSVRFVQGKRTVAEAPCTVGLAEVVYAGTAVHYRTGEGGHDRLIKIVFSDSSLAVEFPADSAVAVDKPTAPSTGGL